MSAASDIPKPRPHWLKPLARMGYGARGVLYLVIAFFALLAAIGGGESEDTRGAIDTLMQNAAGGILVVVLMISLAGYSGWRMVQAGLDADDHGTSAKGLAVRAGLAVSGLVYAVLTIYTFSLWRGSRSEDDAGGGFAEFVSGVVGARLAALALAAILLGVAGAHFWKAYKRKYRDHLRPPPNVLGLIDPIARTGLGARGVVFVIIAILLFTRGLTAGDGGDTPGLREALEFVQGLPAGSVLLGVMALGLAAFAVYSLAEALWRRIDL
jgi:hypothetical protein